MIKVVVCGDKITTEVAELLEDLRFKAKKYKVYRLKKIPFDFEGLVGTNRLANKKDLVNSITNVISTDDKIYICNKQEDLKLYQLLIRNIRYRASESNSNSFCEKWKINTTMSEAYTAVM